MATDDPDEITRIIKETAIRLPLLMELPTPTHAGRIVHGLPRELLGIPDPYKKEKVKHTKIALEIYEKFKEIVQDSEDGLLSAIKIAVAGNIIDFGTGEVFDIYKEVNDVIAQDFAVLDYNEFKRALDKTDKILYLADNAGETVFDKILIEQLGKPVSYAVKGLPVLNDATYEDALMAGIDNVANVINSGSDAPGIVLDCCNQEFRDMFNKSQFIISKGQGNHEALSDVDAPIFFLMRIKCRPVADYLGLKKGDIILKMQNAVTCH